MRLSVVIPVYNVEAYVGKTMESVFATKAGMDEFEVIVVNDGTLDRSMEVVRRFADHSNLSILEQENHGLSIARMNGLSVATGDYVWFVDSDDCLVEDGIGKVLKQLEEKPESDVLMFPLLWVSEQGVPEGLDFKVDADLKVTGKDVIRKFGFPIWAAERFVIRRTMFENPWLRFPNGKLHEDEYFGAVLLYLASFVRILKDPVYRYCRHDGSITARRSVRSSYDLVSIHRSLMMFMDQVVAPVDREWFRSYCFGRLITSYSHCDHLFGTTEFNQFVRKEGKYVWKHWKQVHPDVPLRKRMGRAFYFLMPSIRQKFNGKMGRLSDSTGIVAEA